jgi:transcriptional regulator with XRE-family HTH domain
MSSSSQEQIDLIHTSRVLRSARKLRGFTQTEAAKNLEISQGMISKLESGILAPSASLWFAATKLFAIDAADSFETGYIDTFFSQNKSGMSENLFRIHSRYLENAEYSIRTIAPVLHYLEAKKGESALKAFLKSKKIDVDYFNILDAKLNVNFLSELVEHISKDQVFSKEQLSTMLNEVGMPGLHGHLRHLYDSAKDSKALLKVFAENGSFYNAGSKYSFKDISKNKVNISVSMPDQPKLNSFLVSYHREFLKKIASYGNAKGVQSIHDSTVNTKGSATCSFEIQLIA